MFTLSSGSIQIFPRMLSSSCPPSTCSSYLSEAPLPLESKLEWSSLGTVLSQRMLPPELQNIPVLQRVQQVVPGTFLRYTHTPYFTLNSILSMIIKCRAFIGGIWTYLNLPDIDRNASLGRREKNTDINNINKDVLRSLFHTPAWEAQAVCPIYE